MKKCILYFSLPALILWAASNVYAESTCQQGLHAMTMTIFRDGWVSTKNDVILTEVFGPVTYSGGKCHASGRKSSSSHIRFALSWERGHWGRTLTASRVSRAVL
ncbi:hypothetical protein [Candidatus Sororendozoicomonas aggregata]|uniref:hypothetical protein n=1 Tax=Candidatus Sororendozoicomonas aggregata TaxID=3073239 RepID=UPI002ED45648